MLGKTLINALFLRLEIEFQSKVSNRDCLNVSISDFHVDINHCGVRPGDVGLISVDSVDPKVIMDHHATADHYQYEAVHLLQRRSIYVDQVSHSKRKQTPHELQRSWPVPETF